VIFIIISYLAFAFGQLFSSAAERTHEHNSTDSDIMQQELIGGKFLVA